MKKFLPIILLVLGIITVVTVFLVVKGKNAKVDDTSVTGGDEEVPEVAIEKRPVLSLTPSADGHWLKMQIKKILIDAATLDYELTYKVPDGRTQGVPGTVKLTTKDDITKDLLMGSESSGKFRYDEGVEGGNLTIRFRDAKGKLVAKFSSDFELKTNISGSTKLGNVDYKADKPDSKLYYITINTVGFLGDAPDGEPSNASGVFSSSSNLLPGSIESENAYVWYKNAWVKVENGKTPDLGYFLTY